MLTRCIVLHLNSITILLISKCWTKKDKIEHVFHLLDELVSISHVDLFSLMFRKNNPLILLEYNIPLAPHPSLYCKKKVDLHDTQMSSLSAFEHTTF